MIRRHTALNSDIFSFDTMCDWLPFFRSLYPEKAMLMPHLCARRISGSASCMLSTISIEAKAKTFTPSATIFGTGMMLASGAAPGVTLM